MFKFLHAADLHLDSPLERLEQYEGAPAQENRDAARRALERLVQLAIDEQVQFVVIAGDLYDSDWKDYGTGLFFIAQMARLREAGIPVYLIAGNHDAANKMTRSLRLPEGILLLDHNRAVTHRLDHLGVAIHGQSFAKQAVMDDLTLKYPQGVKGFFNLGLLHTSADGREGHERYAPCTLDGLKRLEYDYWALGHVHTREMLCEAPYIVFPGNIQGRNPRETGVKGCYLVSVSDKQIVTECEFRPLDVLRWETCRVNLDGAADLDDVLERCDAKLRALRDHADDLLLIVRVELVGTTPAHAALLADREKTINEIRGLAIGNFGEQLWIEKVKLKTHPERHSTPEAFEGPLHELATLIDELKRNPESWAALNLNFAELARSLPSDLLTGEEALRFDDPAWLEEILKEAEPLLQQELGGETAS